MMVPSSHLCQRPSATINLAIKNPRRVLSHWPRHQPLIDLRSGPGVGPTAASHAPTTVTYTVTPIRCGCWP